MQWVAIGFVVALVTISVLFGYVLDGHALQNQGLNLNTSCVKLSEPFYPSVQLVPLSSFEQHPGNYLMGNYNITVFTQNNTVIIRSNSNIGSTSLHRMDLAIVGC